MLMTDNTPFQNEKIAAHYEAWYHTSGRKADIQEKALLESLLHCFPGAESILEVGCGTGHFTHWSRTLGYAAYGLDQSRNMLRQAVKNYPTSCHQGDALALPFASQTFDIVALITTLEFISEPTQALSEALRVARRGILLGVINQHSLLGLRYRLKGGPIWRSAKFYSPARLKRLLTKVIFQEYEVVVKTTLCPFSSGVCRLAWGGFIGLAVKLADIGG